MAAAVRYDLKGYNRVRNSLRKLASEYREEIDSTIKDWAAEQRAALKRHGYPPQRNAPQPFKTERQRRWFFWALRSGIISVPYPRTGRLANSWLSRQVGWGHYVVENSAVYAALVVGRDKQARYHEGHWWIAEDVLDEEVGDLTEKLTEELIGLTE